jgi:hypothetical protein
MAVASPDARASQGIGFERETIFQLFAGDRADCTPGFPLLPWISDNQLFLVVQEIACDLVGHRLDSRQRESRINRLLKAESKLLRCPRVKEMPEHAHYF